jgi:hypothetical protein
VDGEGLHIVPTLTTESTDITPDELINGYVLNLTTAGTCTTDDVDMCSIRSNKTAGEYMVISLLRMITLDTKAVFVSRHHHQPCEECTSIHQGEEDHQIRQN